MGAVPHESIVTIFIKHKNMHAPPVALHKLAIGCLIFKTIKIKNLQHIIYLMVDGLFKRG